MEDARMRSPKGKTDYEMLKEFHDRLDVLTFEPDLFAGKTPDSTIVTIPLNILPAAIDEREF